MAPKAVVLELARDYELAAEHPVSVEAVGGVHVKQRMQAVYGEWPGLAKQDLFLGRDLQVKTDYRRVLRDMPRTTWD